MKNGEFHRYKNFLLSHLLTVNSFRKNSYASNFLFLKIFEIYKFFKILLMSENPGAYSESRDRIREKKERETVVLEVKTEEFEKTKEKMRKRK